MLKESPDVNCRLCLARGAKGELGRCGAGKIVDVSTSLMHGGEEPPLSGDGSFAGSGTIFFTRRVFCQNWQISQVDSDRDLPVEKVADLMPELQELGG